MCIYTYMFQLFFMSVCVCVWRLCQLQFGKKCQRNWFWIILTFKRYNYYKHYPLLLPTETFLQKTPNWWHFLSSPSEPHSQVWFFDGSTGSKDMAIVHSRLYCVLRSLMLAVFVENVTVHTWYISRPWFYFKPRCPFQLSFLLQLLSVTQA